jgi:purine-binding chemotaxis protein CheW
MAPAEDFLAIRLGTERYLIRSSEIAGLFVDKKITPVPGRVASLLGIAGFRGAIVPVYDLRALLGHPAADASRWLIMASAIPVALVFDAFDGHLRVSREGLVRRESGEDGRRHVREFAHEPGNVRPILHLASVLDAIRLETSNTASSEEI